MKKIFSLLLTIALLAGCLLVTTGCDKKEKKANDDMIEISYKHGRGVFKISVPKDEEGKPKYEFTTEKPKELSTSASFYLVTDKAVFGFSTNGLVYNTSKAYKEKYGDTKATYDGFLEFTEDKELYNKNIYIPGFKEMKINGRKAFRYYNRVGSSNNYKYYGFFYNIGVDDIYPGSKAQMTVNYKTDDKPTESKEFDKETLSIIKSLKIETNAQ